jgi:hypothetical protein
VPSNRQSRAFGNRLLSKPWALHPVRRYASGSGCSAATAATPGTKTGPQAVGRHLLEGGTCLLSQELRESARERGHARQGVNAKRGVWGRGLTYMNR